MLMNLSLKKNLMEMIWFYNNTQKTNISKLKKIIYIRCDFEFLK